MENGVWTVEVEVELKRRRDAGWRLEHEVG